MCYAWVPYAVATIAAAGGAKMQADATIEAARIRAESQAIADERAATINADVERERIASQERIAIGKAMQQSQEQPTY